MKTLEQQRTEEIKTKGTIRAVIHFSIPVVLFILLLFLNRDYALIVPIGYTIFMSTAQYIRLKKSKNKILKTYSKIYFDFLQVIALLLVLLIVVIGVLV